MAGSELWAALTATSCRLQSPPPAAQDLEGIYSKSSLSRSAIYVLRVSRLSVMCASDLKLWFFAKRMKKKPPHLPQLRTGRS